MNPASPAHPAPQQLHAYCLGKLPEAEMLSLHAHLESCPACAVLLTRVREDTFLEKLRHGGAGDGTRPQDARPQDASTPEMATHASTVGPTAAWQLPPPPVPVSSKPATQAPPAPAKAATPVAAAPAGAAPSPLAPPSIAGLEVVKQLGKGGMGVVYLVRQTELNRLAALKVLRKGENAGINDLARFKAEATTIAGLQHDNIVQIYQVGAQGDIPYLLLEYVEGGTLAQKTAQGPLAPRQAAAIGMTLAKAVHFAHEKGVIHRDLKPANILLNNFGKPKINDFGLAKRQIDLTHITQTEAILGTPSYMAPEQAAGKSRDITPLADVYSLGAILYEMLVGRPPFKGESMLVTLRQVLRHDPIQPRALEPAIPADLEAICLKCLEKSPAQRYASAQALAEDLRRFLANEPVQARPARWWERSIKWVRRRPALAGFLAASVVTFAVLIFALTRMAYSARLEDALDEATKQKTVAEEEGARAREQKARATYLAGLYGVRESIDLGTAAGVFDFLEGTKPKAGEKDFRGFEWYHLWRLCNREETTLRHTAPVRAVAVSPDNLWLAAAGRDNLVHLYDLSKRTEVYTFRGHRDAVNALAFTPDGKTLASAAADQSVKLWDIGKKKEIGEGLAGHASGATACVFDPKGKWLATGSGHGDLRIWALADTSKPRLLAKLPLAVTSLAVDPSGKYLAANGSSDHIIRLWEMPDGKEVDPLKGHKNIVRSLAFSPKNELFASGSEDGEVILWDLSNDQVVKTFNLHRGAVHALVFDSSGTKLVSGSFDHSIRVWMPGRKDWIQGMSAIAHTGQVSSVALSGDGRYLVSGSYDQTVKIWGLATLQEPQSPGVHKGAVSAIVFGPDNVMYTSGADNTIARRRLTETNDIVYKTDDFLTRLTGLAMRRLDNNLVMVGAKGSDAAATGEIYLFDTVARIRNRVGAHGAAISAVAISSDGKLLAVAGTDRVIKVWNLDFKGQVATFTGHLDQIHALAFAPDNKTVASGGEGNQVLLWDVETQKQKGSLKGFAGLVRGILFSPDGKALVVGGENTTTHQCPVQVWDLAENKLANLLKGHTGTVNAMAFSPDGKQLATVAHDQTVKLWDWQTGEERATYKEHLAPIRAVAFSNDGRTLISGDEDGTLIIRHGASDAEVTRKRE